MKDLILALDINLIPENLNEIQRFIFLEILLLMLTLFSILHVFGYFISLYIINKTDLENKHYLIKLYIKVYKNTSNIFLIYDILIIIVSYLFIIFMGFYILWHTLI